MLKDSEPTLDVEAIAYVEAPFSPFDTVRRLCGGFCEARAWKDTYLAAKRMHGTIDVEAMSAQVESFVGPQGH